MQGSFHWGWVFGRAEPELEALYQWMDTENQRLADWRLGIVGAVIGTSWGLAGAGFGVMVGAFGLPVVWIAAPVGFGLAVSAGTLAWYFRSRTSDEKLHARLRGEAKGFIQKLTAARWTGRIKATLGEDTAMILNSAAKEWLRCKSALESPVWKASGVDSPWKRARDSAVRSLDGAMARLVLLASAGSLGSQSGGPGATIIEDMRTMASEAVRLADRLASRTGSMSGDASGDLRRSLGEMRMLSEAEEELGRLTERI